MTIESWNLFFSAGIAALLSIGGIWLKHVVDQQLRAKDSSIQSLESVIKSKEAEISALKADTAPAIVKAYSDMRQHANEMTEEVQRLFGQVKLLSAKQVKTVEQRPELFTSFQAAVNEARGLHLASDILLQALNKHVFSDNHLSYKLRAGDVADDFMDCFAEANRQTASRLKTAEDIKNLMVQKV
jgi:hypothetical protein